jgi:2-succinyl-5-enolpyruvyl-6-hydroxy-3-cyclohexene-1-carboxylate synthase
MSKTTSKIGVQILLEALIHHGIEDLVFSPGSRNAPLVIGLVGSGKFRSVCIHDERSAAFYAMGIALVSRKPVPVICTSGSALLNYSPAVAEAYYQRIPLVVISADRPLEWIDQGDGQTIRQNGVYTNFIDYQVSFPSEARTQEMQWHYNHAIQKALCFARMGPVHINIPFEEPLYEQVDYRPLNFPQLTYKEPHASLKPLDFHALAREWLQYNRRMFIVGQMNSPHKLNEALEPFANDPNTIILCENTSNLSIEGIIPCIDRTLAVIENKLDDYRPDALMILGNAVISKKIKAFLRNTKLQLVWKIGEDFAFMDTYQRLDQSFILAPEQFLFGLNQAVVTEPRKTNGDYAKKWKDAFSNSELIHQEFLKQLDFCDLKVIHTIFKSLPSNSVIHLGNSSIARYVQLFDLPKNAVYHCNRGTSGIDGSMSTAVGAAYKERNKMHILIIGDISFFYDSNALWNNYMSDNLRIIMIHNGGGGIFEIIPGPRESEFRKDFFVAEHNFSAKHICAGFEIEYNYVNEEDDLKNALEQLYQKSENGRPKVLEIDTRNKINAESLKNYFNAMIQIK